ncbi:hypothetical protein G9A89_008128 [Geosiphon pyriformis]|nr:hypothetical protein G9A89_008128 [Geosiphon pyriformis]
MHSIALIETACKIFSKILSDWILLACSTFDILHSDNFLVLKNTSTQSPIFAVGSIIEDALEKNHELWLILQDMKKVYNSVGWKHLSKYLVRIKMCDKFIRFFGGIHRDYTNRVITDFGLTSGYHVHDGLNQGEASVYEYRLNSYFISKNGCAKSQVRFFMFFAAGAFVDDTIWVSNSLRATQHILNVASEFFRINDILINNDKTMIIPINSRVSNFSLFISGSPIFIARKEDLVKAYSNICFFTNLVLRKTITDKQLLYLVSAVFYSIVGYRTQFSFVPVGVYNKWDVMIHKALKLKSGLPLNFPGDTIHHPSFYGLKSFLQVQSKAKIASLISFVNSSGILGHLFSHRSYDLQVLCWHPVHPLSCPVCICVSAFNNFLTGLIYVLFDCNLSLDDSLANAFHFIGRVLMSAVLGKLRFFKFLPSLQHYGIAFINQLCNHHGFRLDPYGLIPNWFRLSAAFLDGVTSSSDPSSVSNDVGPLSILGSGKFLSVCDHLSYVETGCLSVYMDRSLRNLDTVGYKAGTAAFFEDVGLGLGVGILGLMSSTLAELQVIALALECIPPSSLVHLFSDSQSVLNVYKLELGLLHLDFCSETVLVYTYGGYYTRRIINYQAEQTINETTIIIVTNRFEHQVMNLLFDLRPQRITCIILQRTSTNKNKPKVAESENIGANHLGFVKSLFQQYSQQLGLNSNHYPAKLAFNFYVNDKITECLRGTVNIKAARENFYIELFQYTSLPRNHSFTLIIREINQTIKRYVQQQFSITYVDKGKGRLQTPAKQRIESLSYLLYHHTLGSTINISSTDASTPNATSIFGRFPFQSKQKKAELLGPYGKYFEGFKLRSPTPSRIRSPPPPPDFGISDPWKVTESEEEKEEETEDQEFTYQNLITENPELRPQIFRTTEPIQQPLQLPLQQNQQPLQQPPQPPNLDPMAYAPIAKLDNFTSKENDTQVWLNNMKKAITANGWNDSLINKPQDFNAFKVEFLRYFSNNNSINCLVNTFTIMKQGETEAVTTYLRYFHRNLHQIQAIDANYFTVPQILNQFICGLHSSILQHVHPLHPGILQDTVTHARDFESAESEANHAQAVNLVMNRSSELESKLKQFNNSINQKLEGYLTDNHAIYQPLQ